MAHMSSPCHEGPPATAGHLCSEPAVAGGGRYYCTNQSNFRNFLGNIGDGHLGAIG